MKTHLIGFLVKAGTQQANTKKRMQLNSTVLLPHVWTKRVSM